MIGLLEKSAAQRACVTIVSSYSALDLRKRESECDKVKVEKSENLRGNLWCDMGLIKITTSELLQIISSKSALVSHL